MGPLYYIAVWAEVISWLCMLVIIFCFKNGINEWWIGLLFLFSGFLMVASIGCIKTYGNTMREIGSLGEKIKH